MVHLLKVSFQIRSRLPKYFLEKPIAVSNHVAIVSISVNLGLWLNKTPGHQRDIFHRPNLLEMRFWEKLLLYAFYIILAIFFSIFLIADFRRKKDF